MAKRKRLDYQVKMASGVWLTKDEPRLLVIRTVKHNKEGRELYLLKKVPKRKRGQSKAAYVQELINSEKVLVFFVTKDKVLKTSNEAGVVTRSEVNMWFLRNRKEELISKNKKLIKARTVEAVIVNYVPEQIDRQRLHLKAAVKRANVHLKVKRGAA